MPNLNKIHDNMTVNENDINSKPDSDIQAKIEEAMNSNQEYNQEQIISANLDQFGLTEDNNGYLLVSHAALNDSYLGKIGVNEYASSKDKVALLKSIVKDSFPQTKISFTGSFIEPVIEKVAAEPMPKMPAKCEVCEDLRSEKDPSSEYDPTCVGYLCPKHEEERYAKKDQPEVKKSWLGDMEPPMTDLETPMAGAEFMEYECPVCKETFEDYDLGQHDKTCPGTPEVMHDEPAISIEENMPRASMTDHLQQSIQAEQQLVSSQQEKIKTEAVNALVSMLKAQGYGTAKVAEVTESKTGYDVMVTVDADAALRAVNIPVTIKEGKVVLPKKALVSELISKGLDIQAKLAESFSQEVLNKIAETEARIQYEAQEATDIINEKVASLDKVGGDEPKTQFEGTNEQIILNKHLLSNDASDLSVGDVVHVDGISYKLVSKTHDVLSRGEDDGSQWTFEKVTPISK